MISINLLSNRSAKRVDVSIQSCSVTLVAKEDVKVIQKNTKDCQENEDEDEDSETETCYSDYSYYSSDETDDATDGNEVGKEHLKASEGMQAPGDSNRMQNDEIPKGPPQDLSRGVEENPIEKEDAAKKASLEDSTLQVEINEILNEWEDVSEQVMQNYQEFVQITTRRLETFKSRVKGILDKKKEAQVQAQGGTRVISVSLSPED